MKDFIGIIVAVTIIVGCLGLSKVIFDAIINSDLSPFWKYMLLK